jgi:lysophospholipase L1-like esterase
VTLGDSFMSGEGGLWNGNTITGVPEAVTDRSAHSTWFGWASNPEAIYGNTWTDPTQAVGAEGCHRSDPSEARNSGIAMQAAVNLACSGARTPHVIRAASGGQTYRGEAPQADQLATIARSYSVKVVVLSISGNDLGFKDIISNCVSANMLGGSLCNPSQQAAVTAAMPTAMNGLRAAIDSVRSAMSSAGSAPSSYRFIVQSYPSPVPNGNRMVDPGVRGSMNCPMYTADADWARNTLVPTIDDNVKAVAMEKGVQYLDLRDALKGHELCSTEAGRATQFTGPGAPTMATMEWVRYLHISGPINDGYVNESFHPNAYGHQAMATCLGLLYNNHTTGNYRCSATAGQGVEGISLAAV